MSEQPTLLVTERKDFGKGAARKARVKNLIPAVIYGHGVEPEHVYLPYHETFLIVKDAANAVISLKGLDKDRLVLVKDVQRHPVRRNLQHLDLLVVKAGEKVEVEVPLEVIGEPASGTAVTLDLLNIVITAPVTHLPEMVRVSVEGAEEGTVLTVADLQLPQGVESTLDPETVVLSVTVPQAVDLPDSESTNEESEAEAAGATEE